METIWKHEKGDLQGHQLSGFGGPPLPKKILKAISNENREVLPP